MEEEFRVRPGRIRDRGRPGRGFVGQVLRAVERAGGRAGPPRRGLVRGGRGQAAALLAELRSPGRRVVVKARIVRHAGARFRAAPLPAHLAYLQRDGTERDGARGRLFGPDGPADGRAFAARCEGDRHHFRFIVSPEDGAQLADLGAFARDLMRQAEADLGGRLDWVGVAHWNTARPHLHLLVRGVDDTGSDLVIARDYITRGLRGRAEALASLELGPRTAREIAAAAGREVSAERWTRLDRSLEVLATDGVVDLRPGAGLDPEARALLAGRAAALARLGLAAGEGPGRWTLDPELRERLHALALRQDILVRLQRAQPGRRPEDLVPSGEAEGLPVLGRVAGRGLHDALTGTAYLVLDGVDGRLRHVRLPDLAAAGDTPAGGLVEVRGGEDGPRVLNRSDLALDAQVRAWGATWLDRRLLAGAEQGLAAHGFGAEVREALAARRQWLVDNGLATRSGRGVTLAPGLLSALRDRELGAAGLALGREAGAPYVASGVGDAVRGLYLRRLDLASGRFAAVLSEDAVRLLPWAGALDRRLGRTVSGRLGPDGMAWDLGRGREPGP